MSNISLDLKVSKASVSFAPIFTALWLVELLSESDRGVKWKLCGNSFLLSARSCAIFFFDAWYVGS